MNAECSEAYGDVETYGSHIAGPRAAYTSIHTHEPRWHVLARPPCRLGVIQFNAIPSVVCDSKIELRVRVSGT